MRVSLHEACQLLMTGNVVALPTETVYGLAASIAQPVAIDKIFRLKGRPANNPLIIHVADATQAHHFTSQLPDHFTELAQAFWPGPLTMVIPIIREMVPPQVRANLLTAGFRVPNHPLTCEIIKSIGPIVMPSANLSGKPSGTKTTHVEADFGADFPVVDGGSCECGLESTIMTFRHTRWEIIRLGALSAEKFISILGYKPEFVKQDARAAPLCPGQLYRHYAPNATLILNEKIPADFTGIVLGFNERCYTANCQKVNLGSLSNPEDVAENLYAILRELDQNNILEAYVDMDFPKEGLWTTIAERLTRAAT